MPPRSAALRPGSIPGASEQRTRGARGRPSRCSETCLGGFAPIGIANLDPVVRDVTCRNRLAVAHDRLLAADRRRRHVAVIVVHVLVRDVLALTIDHVVRPWPRGVEREREDDPETDG